VEIEHILPFSQTLDDSLNNKTLATRRANRVKGNRTPAQAREDFEREGWTYDAILQRAERMPRNKRYRFGPDGYEKWLREDKDFLARALNDTRHLSRVAREYLSLICPQSTRVIPGRMTAMLRAKFGLNDILGLQGEKNRNDHRHHAVDACVIAVTDQGMLQRFAQASASAREKQLDKLVDSMPLPWPLTASMWSVPSATSGSAISLTMAYEGFNVQGDRLWHSPRWLHRAEKPKRMEAKDARSMNMLFRLQRSGATCNDMASTTRQPDPTKATRLMEITASKSQERHQASGRV
jgi:hypothetical protein